MGIFKNIKCIRNVICDIQRDMTVIREQLKIINETIINKLEDGKAYDSIVLVPSKKMGDMGQMPTIIHRGEKINTDNMTSFNLSWSYGDGAILTTERE